MFFAIYFFNDFLLYISGTLISQSILLILNIHWGKNFRFQKIRKDLLKNYIKLGLILFIPKLTLTFSNKCIPSRAFPFI